MRRRENAKLRRENEELLKRIERLEKLLRRRCRQTASFSRDRPRGPPAGPAYRTLAQRVRQSPVVHTDDTGWRIRL